MNKSRIKEYRVIHINDRPSYPCHIEYRYLGWRSIFGWFTVMTSYSEDNFAETFSNKEAAIEHVEGLIRTDNYIPP
jgi:hypothetical protein